MEVLLLDPRRVILELRDTLLPVQEKHTLFTV
jgi:hypothetical protein